MGMFDEIKWKGKTWQTKDFDCQLATYRIENGRLIYQRFHYESVPKGERTYPNAEEGTWQSAIGSIRSVDDGPEDTNFHGVLNLYRMPKADDRDPSAAYWEEWNLKFTNGNLTEEVLVERRMEA